MSYTKDTEYKRVHSAPGKFAVGNKPRAVSIALCQGTVEFSVVREWVKSSLLFTCILICFSVFILLDTKVHIGKLIRGALFTTFLSFNFSIKQLHLFLFLKGTISGSTGGSRAPKGRADCCPKYRDADLPQRAHYRSNYSEIKCPIATNNSSELNVVIHKSNVHASIVIHKLSHVVIQNYRQNMFILIIQR